MTPLVRFHDWDVKRLSRTQKHPVDGYGSKCGARGRAFPEHRTPIQNRLHSVIGPLYAGFYGYDGNGNRVWKLTGECSFESQNGEAVSYSVRLDDGVLYPNPYIAITPTGYTKHYFSGAERIATMLGEGGWGSGGGGRENAALILRQTQDRCAADEGWEDPQEMQGERTERKRTILPFWHALLFGAVFVMGNWATLTQRQ